MLDKNFLKNIRGTIVFIILNCFVTDSFAQNNLDHGTLLTLSATPPEGTKAVHFFIDGMRVSTLTDLYASKTATKPVWKTVIDPAWIGAGEHSLRIKLYV